MWNVINKMFSYIDPDLDLVRYSCAGTSTCEIISGYVSPQYEVDKCAALDAPTRKRIGILYADIAGSNRLGARPEDDVEVQIEEAIKILMTNIADNDGRLVNIDGHAILAEFGDTDRALHCAINVQLAARQWNANLPLERQLLFRIGLAYRAGVSIPGKINGNTASLAEYLEGLAFAGGICISESVRDDLDDHPSFKLVGAGKQYVKNICEPVETFWIEIDTEQIEGQELTGTVKVTATAS